MKYRETVVCWWGFPEKKWRHLLWRYPKIPWKKHGAKWIHFSCHFRRERHQSGGYGCKKALVGMVTSHSFTRDGCQNFNTADPWKLLRKNVKKIKWRWLPRPSPVVFAHFFSMFWIPCACTSDGGGSGFLAQSFIFQRWWVWFSGSGLYFSTVMGLVTVFWLRALFSGQNQSGILHLRNWTFPDDFQTASLDPAHEESDGEDDSTKWLQQSPSQNRNMIIDSMIWVRNAHVVMTVP